MNHFKCFNNRKNKRKKHDKKKIVTENEETGGIKKIALLGPRVTDGRVF